MPASVAKAKKIKRREPIQAMPSVTIIGHGNWGAALAAALKNSGIPLHEIVARSKPSMQRTSKAHAGARLTLLRDAALDADVLWICTPDASIASVARQLASRLAKNPRRKPPVVFHSSGALASTELAALRTAGASVASVHPLMTFPKASFLQREPQQGVLTGVPFAIEGDARACRAARQLVRALGGEPFIISTADKPLHHIFGAFASPLLVALLTAAMETAVAAGYTRAQARRRMRPIVERTISNFFANGPERSFSGPIARGDASTIARHLEALGPYPELLAIYRELTRFALDSLPAQNGHPIQKLLQSRFE